MSKGPNFHHQNTSHYDIYAKLDSGSLEIMLKTISENPRQYKKKIISTNLPPEISKSLLTVETMLECLKSQECHEIYYQTGEILFKIFIRINQKDHPIVTCLKLQQTTPKTEAKLAQHIVSLKKIIQALKISIPYQIESVCQKDMNARQRNIIKQIKDFLQKQIQSKIQNLETNKKNAELLLTKVKLAQQEINQLRKSLEKQKKHTEVENTTFTEDLNFILKRVSELQNSFASFKEGNTVDKMKQFLKDLCRQEEINSSFQENKEWQEVITAESNPFTNLFDTETPFFQNFICNETNRTIKYNGKDKENCQLLGSSPIYYNSQSIFSFKIIKSKKKSIFIGVVDKKQRLFPYSYCSGNALSFYGGGRVWFGSIESGKFIQTQSQFQEGDIVTMIIQRQQGLILWKVNDSLAYSLTSALLKDKKRQIVPYFEMKRKGDIIEWIS